MIKKRKDLRGKYLYHNVCGFIYVRRQFVNGGFLCLQGLGFNSNKATLSFCLFYEAETRKEWQFSIDDNNFENRIIEVTKEEFIDKFNYCLEE